MDEINRELRSDISNKKKKIIKGNMTIASHAPLKLKPKSSSKRKFRIIGAEMGSLIKQSSNLNHAKGANSITDYMQDDTIIGLKTVLEHSIINYKTDITGFIPLPLQTTVTNTNTDKSKSKLKTITSNNNNSKDMPLKAISSIFNKYISSAKDTREQWNTVLGNALDWKGSRVYTKTTSEGDKIFVSYNFI